MRLSAQLRSVAAEPLHYADGGGARGRFFARRGAERRHDSDSRSAFGALLHHQCRGLLPRKQNAGEPFQPASVCVLNFFPLPEHRRPDRPAPVQLPVSVLTQKNPREDKILRVDYNVSSKTHAFVRLLKD